MKDSLENRAISNKAGLVHSKKRHAAVKWMKPALGNLKCKLMRDFMRTLLFPVMIQVPF